ncbi:MAG: aminotransferase class V-fold PLP-dependent enzyme [Chloroflexi bacterium]|nr:aminotransferase class V-fold PLP-dependent enzyme [Chloroflexota bacterium]
MDFDELRRSTAGLDAMTYLNTGWAGPSPERVLARMRETAAEESRLGPASPDGLALAKHAAGTAKDAAARLLGADPGDVVLTHGTTEGVNAVLHGLAWEPGDELLTSDLEHPALEAPAALLSARHGVRVQRVRLAPDASADEALAAIVSSITPRTRLVALSHIMYTCGLVLPAPAVARAVHEAGAMILFDGAQSGGHIRLDMGEIDADFYTVSGQKWLLGPSSTGALYVRRDRHDTLTPLVEAPGLSFVEGIDTLALTSSSAALHAGFAEAVGVYEALGPDRAEARIRELAARLRDGFSKTRGVAITGPADPAAVCGLSAIAVDGWAADALADALWERHRVAARTVRHPEGVRFSTAAFNDEGDVDRAIEAVRSLSGEAAARRVDDRA